MRLRELPPSAILERELDTRMVAGQIGRHSCAERVRLSEDLGSDQPPRSQDRDLLVCLLQLSISRIQKFTVSLIALRAMPNYSSYLVEMKYVTSYAVAPLVGALIAFADAGLGGFDRTGCLLRRKSERPTRLWGT